ncbi:ABC transporter permease [Lachnospiraceae bacterium WCA-9-b2]|uniref:Transport permease protein n=1 Tax=Sporofaciens musculi TaxID=2681861 RepID=A0A7X3SJV2_9FIRM|nr:ABC transporter permease [Sporofaciens musculi]MXP76933.1 ABC transporter permease [Sporofaciens musculi]
MSTYIQNFLKFRPLLNELVARDIKIKYRRSILGVLWTLLNPLLMMVVLSVVFTNLFKFDIENFPIYILSGQAIFNFYSDATNNGMASILGSASLIKKVYIPKYLFVVSRICSSVINLAASFSALLLVMMAMRVELHYTIILSIIPVLLLIVFSLGIGLLLAALVVKFRDIMHLYSVFITALMYLTPVIYPMSILPDWLSKIVRFNPLTNYLMMFRNVMLNNTVFGVGDLCIGILEAGVSLAVGLFVFYRNQDTFILNL